MGVFDSILLNLLTSGVGTNSLKAGSNAFADASAASGTIVTVVGSLLAVGVDTDTFTLDDGVNPAVQFIYDDDSSVVETATIRAINHTGVETIDGIRNLTVSAINLAPTLDITATSSTTGRLVLINDTIGTVGNVAIIEAVSDPGFVVTGMTGGTATGAATIAIGLQAVSGGDGSISIGDTALSRAPGGIAIGLGAELETSIATDGIAIGTGAIVAGPDGIALGNGAQALGTGSCTAFGSGALANQISSTAFGFFAQATGLRSSAFGSGATATTGGGGDNTSFGQSADAGGGECVAIGGNAQALATQGTAIGEGAIAGGNTSVSIGQNCVTSGNQVVGIGQGALVGAFSQGVGYNIDLVGSSVCIGWECITTATYGHAFGERAKTTHQNSIALGAYTESTAINRCTIGSVGFNARRMDLEISGDEILFHGGSLVGDVLTTKRVESLDTGLSGASVVTGLVVPAGSILRGLGLRVTTAITGATSFDIGDGTDTDRFGAGISIALGTTTSIADWTAVGTVLTSAMTITLTAVGPNFSAGDVRLIAYYDTFTAPTS